LNLTTAGHLRLFLTVEKPIVKKIFKKFLRARLS